MMTDVSNKSEKNSFPIIFIRYESCEPWLLKEERGALGYILDSKRERNSIPLFENVFGHLFNIRDQFVSLEILNFKFCL